MPIPNRVCDKKLNYFVILQLKRFHRSNINQWTIIEIIYNLTYIIFVDVYSYPTHI